MNNREWLYSLDVADLSDWFDAEHVENQERALDGDTAALNAKIAELERKLRISWEYECKFQAEREQYRKLFGMALDWAHEITMLELSIDEGMA